MLEPPTQNPMTEQQTKRLSQIQTHTPAYFGITKKAFEGNSKASAIKAKCLDCTCWQRKEITLCTVTACPLWPYRPYQDESETDD
jgi:hypothetical protein